MMIIINPPLAIYKHLAALSFMCAGIFADLLVIRLCLASAYIFLITNCLMGGPLWPHWIKPGHLTVDMLIWGIVCFYVHMSSVVRLLQDEQHVDFRSEEEEALWRMFYRVGGMSRKIFAHQIAPHLKVVRYQKGDTIPVDEFFHINYQGIVKITVTAHGNHLSTAHDGSGCLFDLKNLGLLQMHASPMAHHKLQVTAESDCTLFQFSNAEIRTIANAKNTKSVWQTVLVGTLARIAVQRLPEHFHDDNNNNSDENMKDSSVHYHQDKDTIDPLFLPLSPSELPNPLVAGSGSALERPLAHLAYCLRQFYSPPWPFSKHLVGVRHAMLSAPVPMEGSTQTLEQGINDYQDGDAAISSEQKSLLVQNNGNARNGYNATAV